MDFFSAVCAGVLFALACNLDTVLAAIGQGAGGRMGARELLTVAAVTTTVTFLSLTLGSLGAALLPEGLAERLGGLALTALGLWYVLDAPRGKNSAPGETDHSWLALSAALAVNIWDLTFVMSIQQFTWECRVAKCPGMILILRFLSCLDVMLIVLVSIS